MSVLIEKIQSMIEKSMKDHHIPGAAVAVIKDNKILFQEGYGSTTVEDWGTPIRPHTLFRIASVSKLFTGTMMMMLSEKGLIDLDKPVQYYVPWFTTADWERSKLITIGMLLAHSSGLPTGDALSDHYDDSGLYKYMKEVVPTLPLLFHPGTAYSYGNHALNIGGYIAEQVTNKKFATLMQEMLFDPLEMTHTTYNPLRAMTQSLALPHDKDQSGNLTIAQQFYDNSASYPSYYAFSSLQDLCKFAMMHLQDGLYANKQVIRSSSVEEMRKQHSKWYTVTDAGCGITFFQETKNDVMRYWHYGQYSHQYSSQFILVPEKGIAVIALANGENIFQAGYEIVDELLKEDSKVASEQVYLPAESDPTSFEGSYLHGYYGVLSVSNQNGKIILKHDEQIFKLTHYSNDIYLAKDEQGNTIFTVGFPTPTSTQTTKCIVVNTQACPEFIQEYEPNPSDWVNWEGTYSDGKGTYEVLVQGEFLVIKDQQSNHDLVAQAIEKNRFMTKEYGLVSFIEVKNSINLEFGHAWRYPKQNIIVASM